MKRRRWRRWWCRVQPHTVEEVFRDFKGRRNGMIKALTTDVQEFYRLCNPEVVSDTKKAIELDPALAKAYLRKGLVKEKIEFDVNQMNWPLKAVALFPQLLGYSMGKRIVPRCNVIKALMTKGLLESYNGA
ncbi:hypothetical protein HID58_007011 [Brassica napus]|uniref:PHD finger protein ALFIN-LIKE n=1 Tax=Brassica napus TaxID=3708 RepID=A0ABQ8EFZ4_BRANA|nr:hypothetical protein HID58_007011 [Brassica napus]